MFFAVYSKGGDLLFLPQRQLSFLGCTPLFTELEAEIVSTAQEIHSQLFPPLQLRLDSGMVVL